MSVRPANQQIATATSPVSWTVRNDFGAVKGSGQGGNLGASASATPSIADGASQTRTVVVPAGAERLDVAIGGTSDTGADLDLFVSGPSGAKSAADGDSEEAVSYANPQPGTYTVRIDGYEVPKGTTTFSYRDAFVSPGLGTLSVVGTQLSLANGATGTVTGTIAATGAAEAGRSLFGTMRFVSDGGALLGSGTVTVTATP